MRCRHFTLFAGLLASLALVACGQNDNTQMLDVLQDDLHRANATIDSLYSTVDATNQLVDSLRTRADSLQKVDESLLGSVQQLSQEVREWRQLATGQKLKNDQLTAEIERMKREKRSDQQAINRLQFQSDSLNNALLTAHASIRRQTDHIRELEDQLGQTRTDLAGLQEARESVRVCLGTEQELEGSGYLEVSHPSGRSSRKVYKMIKKIDPADPKARLVGIGESLLLDQKPKLLIDRYGRLKEGQDFKQSQDNGQAKITFPNTLVAGADVLVVIEK
jgi:hypothetical protein